MPVVRGVNSPRFVTVMGEPLNEKLTEADREYKDGYAKFYQFDAIKGQRLTTVAMEDFESNPHSFIRSEIFDENGVQLGRTMDTRIEFNAPYTGTYYYIVMRVAIEEAEGRTRVLTKRDGRGFEARPAQRWELPVTLERGIPE